MMTRFNSNYKHATNRTIVELKLIEIPFSNGNSYTTNRTIVELKLLSLEELS